MMFAVSHDVRMLKLNPTHTMLWRSPTTVQFGSEHPVVVVEEMTTSVERVLTSLRLGVSDVSLGAVALGVGMSEPELASLLSQLAPALLPDAQRRPWNVVVEGKGAFAEAVSHLLVANGHEVVRGIDIAINGAIDVAIDVAIVIADHVLRPDQTGVWLRRDVPHLPVLFGDTEVHIGPFVTPGRGPCLHCVYLEHSERDPSWHILATQLLGRKSPLETELNCAHLAAMMTHWITNSSGSERGNIAPGPPTFLTGLAEGEAVILESATGHLRRVTYRQRPECACQALPQNVTPIETRRVENLARTRTPRGVFSPG